MQYAIRMAGLFDVAALALIQRAAIDAIDDRSYGAEKRRAWRNRPAGELCALVAAGRYRVAEREGVLVGGAGWEGAGGSGVATIRAVFVHPSVHGRGIGAALVSAIERDILLHGFERLVVPAALNAVGFYERLGYVPAELAEAEFDGVRLAYRRMVKAAA